MKLLYFCLINVLSFCLMGLDKRKAKTGAWRISERTLLLSAAAGGSIGGLLGMRIFRHKTRHRRFSLGIPMILLAQIILICLCVYSTNI